MNCQSDFNNLISTRSDISTKLASLEATLSNMKSKYDEFVENNPKKIYLYCLDSFFFQYKILSVELEHYRRVLSLINNRMYGDYYKLFMIITTQCKEAKLNFDAPTDKILVYKDLDPTFDYKISDVTLLFDSILAILEQLHTTYNNKNTSISSHNENNGVGFSITGFLTTLKYENILLNEQIHMYLDYISFYQSSQKAYFNKALADIISFSYEINGKILVNYRVEFEIHNKTMKLFDNTPEPEPVPIKPLPVLEPIQVPVKPLTVSKSVPEPVQVQEPEPEPLQVQEPEPLQVQEPEPLQIQEPEPLLEPLLEPLPEPLQVQEPEPLQVQEPESIQVQEPEPLQVQEPEPLLEPVLEHLQVQEPEQELVLEPEPTL